MNRKKTLRGEYSSTGVPLCGVRALCPPMQEERLLRLGAAMEEALG